MLAIGRCVEVWAGTRVPAAHDADYDPVFSAKRRFDVVRNWWLDDQDVDTTAARCTLIPVGAPWSVYVWHGAAGQIRTVRQPTAHAVRRIERAGVTVRDLANLAAEAQTIHARALRATQKPS